AAVDIDGRCPAGREDEGLFGVEMHRADVEQDFRDALCRRCHQSNMPPPLLQGPLDCLKIQKLRRMKPTKKKNVMMPREPAIANSLIQRSSTMFKSCARTPSDHAMQSIAQTPMIIQLKTETWLLLAISGGKRKKSHTA